MHTGYNYFNKYDHYLGIDDDDEEVSNTNDEDDKMNGEDMEGKGNANEDEYKDRKWVNVENGNIEEEMRERETIVEGHDDDDKSERKKVDRENEYDRTEEEIGLGKGDRKEHVEMEGHECKTPRASPLNISTDRKVGGNMGGEGVGGGETKDAEDHTEVEKAQSLTERGQGGGYERWEK